MERTEYEKTYELEDSYWWFVGRRRLATALLEQWTRPNPNGLVLDVGCGTGGNLAFLSQWGRGVGADLSPLALDFARRRRLSPLTQASGLALPFPNNTFSLVTAFDVLYHHWITDDRQAIRECYRVLQPGGWLLLTVPALPGLWSRHDEVYCARQRYRLEELRQKLMRCGFRLEKLSYANTLLLPAMMASRLLARWFPSVSAFELRPLPGWLNGVLTGVLSLEAAWLRWGTFPVGGSLVALTQKPG